MAVAILLATLGGLALPTSVSNAAQKTRFTEETAQAFWVAPYTCSDGSTVDATLLVQSTRDFESPATEDADPTVRVHYLAVCLDGSSFSWIGFIPATITSTGNLASVTATGSGTVRDNLGDLHQVSFDVQWTAVGPVKTTVNGPGSTTKQRRATATGQVIFDGQVLVNGAANHPTRPAPFIRTDIEK
jgi:hypothetical protein